MSEEYSGFTSLNVEGADVVSYTVQRRKKRMLVIGVGVAVGCATLLALVMFGSSSAKTALATLMAPGFSFGSTSGSSDNGVSSDWANGTACDPDPCNDNGHCYLDEGTANRLNLGYYCACQEGWCGYDCEIGITSEQTCRDAYGITSTEAPVTTPSTGTADTRSSSSTSTSPGSPQTSTSTKTTTPSTGTADTRSGSSTTATVTDVDDVTTIATEKPVDTTSTEPSTGTADVRTGSSTTDAATDSRPATTTDYALP